MNEDTWRCPECQYTEYVSYASLAECGGPFAPTVVPIWIISDMIKLISGKVMDALN